MGHLQFTICPELGRTQGKPEARSLRRHPDGANEEEEEGDAKKEDGDGKMGIGQGWEGMGMPGAGGSPRSAWILALLPLTQE